jgi:hypothetical protein
MKEKLQAKILERFQSLFSSDPRSMIRKCGIECEDRWFNFLWKLLEDLEKLEQARWSSMSKSWKEKLAREGEYRGLQITMLGEEFGKLKIVAIGCTQEMSDRMNTSSSYRRMIKTIDLTLDPPVFP